ncbi:helix-turn-helix domain-containing protein [Flavobacterium gawalongense]|uniref:Helix-turn-helix transcriptional regulator n=1 Tax=Flavobacterium gawalongense TaxID=2594432 RepID=A0A553BWW3_9FLAO|nr:helix-turn-helix transcriptional regulator [Flavobacterium gawalongense]TRX04174.1 helix-turn-helix transcriptional regulator [Flavobacterium gawalongense]TRX09376.1 helix-turn-helix transcriptional regulator [Flavobacterium gawalongense]TRX12810.1 helix-turn-helix transcriptional regulator [Flavobacterium gawalongense]TRX13155.1 helix-turn-helix transcriptional regulator [Flavobacterium gawalongense]TRX30783.1 helix-turn-helix transcriptional regulator [Flavobacterium gawalongense]
MEAVIEKIKDIRKQKGFSHEYMAHMLDISQVAYSKIEKVRPNYQ